MPRTFDEHTFQTKLEPISNMDQGVHDARIQTSQHFGLSARISSLLEVVFVRKDKLFESGCGTIFRNLLRKEGDVSLVISSGC